jgi:hypothetical protein
VQDDKREQVALTEHCKAAKHRQLIKLRKTNYCFPGSYEICKKLLAPPPKKKKKKKKSDFFLFLGGGNNNFMQIS